RTGALPLNLALLEHLALANASQPTDKPVPALKQDPAWLAEKQAFRVRRPTRAEANVVVSAPSCTTPCYAYPKTYLLDTSIVANTLEPGPQGTDVSGRAYSDRNMTKLCGPGAAANALAFWSDDIQRAGVARFTDTSNRITTTWDSRHNRSYILYLAWQSAAPTFPHTGLMDTHDLSAGVTIYSMRDGLNWEASGHDLATWKTYFYAITWSDESSAGDFHHKVLDDIANAHVPVVAEVSARLLPNW